MSGQQINFAKSSLQFGHKIEDTTRAELHDILRIYTIRGMISYLEILECLAGSKTQIFGFLQDRMISRVNVWMVKYLTKGGKEVLVKSVATDTPNHVMSCF